MTAACAVVEVERRRHGAPGAVPDTGGALSAVVTWFLGEGTKIANRPPAKPP